MCSRDKKKRKARYTDYTLILVENVDEGKMLYSEEELEDDLRLKDFASLHCMTRGGGGYLGKNVLDVKENTDPLLF